LIVIMERDSLKQKYLSIEEKLMANPPYQKQ
jgi:hypothetical protein